MPDREKVIKEYESFVDKYECFCSSDDYVFEMHKAVLALLKEQEIVRCKDCVHFMPQVRSCRHLYASANPEGFCSDGERRKE